MSFMPTRRMSFSAIALCLFAALASAPDAHAQSAVDRSKILATNEAFYDSFRNGDLDKMKTVWSGTSDVGMIPPGRDFLQGLNQVMAAFQLMMLQPPKIECQMEAPIGFRDGKAIIICNERLGVSESVRMMNVLAPETIDDETEWKMIYHGPAGEDKRRT
jgi:hypothetical protein